MTRREVIAAIAAAGALAARASSRFRLAVCNETFEGSSFADACRLAVATGYTGLEIMPSTLAPDPASLSPDRRADLRRAMRDAGVAFTGLHAVVSAPAGLHLTTSDDAARRRGWDYFGRMIDLCADLGPDGYLVLGSSKQRAALQGESVQDAVKRLRDGLAAARSACARSRRAAAGGAAGAAPVQRPHFAAAGGGDWCARSIIRRSRPCSTRITRSTRANRTTR